MNFRGLISHRVTTLTLVVVSALVALDGAAAQTRSVERGPSGLPLPRYVSLKAEPVNMRKGPGTQYPTAWVLRQAGMPLEIVREYEGWRQVRDAEGTTGWILGALLSGRRTGQVRPWDQESGDERPIVGMHRRADEESPLVARLEAGALVDIESCDGRWCAVRLLDFRGYIAQKVLWGVYPNEAFE